MRLRKLEQKDAPLMYEWMQDPSVVRDLQTKFLAKTLEDCRRFIDMSHTDQHNRHLAVVSDEDEYMGTVSLKNIHADRAEFAITVRSSAMGKGYAKYAMMKMIEKGFFEMGLSAIYWCVSPDNHRAIRFYEKGGFARVRPEFINGLEGYSTEQVCKYIWYCVYKTDRR